MRVGAVSGCAMSRHPPADSTKLLEFVKQRRDGGLAGRSNRLQRRSRCSEITACADCPGSTEACCAGAEGRLPTDRDPGRRQAASYRASAASTAATHVQHLRDVHRVGARTQRGWPIRQPARRRRTAGHRRARRPAPVHRLLCDGRCVVRTRAGPRRGSSPVTSPRKPWASSRRRSRRLLEPSVVEASELCASPTHVVSRSGRQACSLPSSCVDAQPGGGTSVVHAPCTCAFSLSRLSTNWRCSDAASGMVDGSDQIQAVLELTSDQLPGNVGAVEVETEMSESDAHFRRSSTTSSAARFSATKSTVLPRAAQLGDQVRDGLAFPRSGRTADDAVSAAQRQPDRLLLGGIRVAHEELVVRRDGIELARDQPGDDRRARAPRPPVAGDARDDIMGGELVSVLLEVLDDRQLLEMEVADDVAG